MTYKWQEQMDPRLKAHVRLKPLETAGRAERSAEATRWTYEMRRKGSDGPTAPRKFSWEND